jgi:site-specific DNA-methyltransferase (adenine-specific)
VAKDILGQAPAWHIHLGDCVAGMHQLDASSVDLVVTSPPYNLGKEYSTYDDNKTPEEYLEWCEDWACQIARVLRPDGSLFLNLGASSANLLFPFQVASKIANECGLKLQNTIHWIKSISIDREEGTQSYGHFKPINSERFLNDCQEYVFHFTKNRSVPLDRLAVGVPYQDKSNIARWGHTKGRDKRCRGNTWFIPYETIRERAKERPHPATFPVELAAKCIRLHGKKDAVVMDPFLGIGHAALGARDCSGLVSRFIGFDIDKEYIDVCCRLLNCGYTKVTDVVQARALAAQAAEVRPQRAAEDAQQLLFVTPAAVAV